MDTTAAFQALAELASQKEVVFPSSARVALQVQQLISDPDCSTDKAAQLIQAEPVLAARVVAVANSVSYNRAGKQITDVRNAVTRIGFRTVQALTTALITKQLMRKPSQGDAGRAAKLWEHTTHMAALAHVLARRVTRADAETALFAGIVHEVGGFFLLAHLDRFPTLLDDGGLAWQTEGEAIVGDAVLNALGVPPKVFEAIRNFRDGYLTMPPVSLTDTLLLAEHLAPVPSPLQCPSPETEGMKAQVEVALGEHSLSEILAESAEEVGSLNSALRF